MTHKNWSLIGLPDDEGVENTGGRKGAAEGPAKFRPFFEKMKGPDLQGVTIKDKGDITTEGSIEERHQRATDTIVEEHESDNGTLIIGGGHDYGFPHLRALHQFTQQNDQTYGCINIDSHFDVRKPEPEIKSGSPFRMAIDNGVITPERLVEFGIQRQSNAPELFEYIEKQGVPYTLFDEIRMGGTVPAYQSWLNFLSQHCDRLLISFDLDSMASAFAPGVSAPQPEGFTSREAIEMLRLAGQNPKVISLGIYELNPKYDIDDRTARMAAVGMYHFLAGVQQR